MEKAWRRGGGRRNASRDFPGGGGYRFHPPEKMPGPTKKGVLGFFNGKHAKHFPLLAPLYPCIVQYVCTYILYNIVVIYVILAYQNGKLSSSCNTRSGSGNGAFTAFKGGSMLQNVLSAVSVCCGMPG